MSIVGVRVVHKQRSKSQSSHFRLYCLSKPYRHTKPTAPRSDFAYRDGEPRVQKKQTSTCITIRQGIVSSS